MSEPTRKERFDYFAEAEKNLHVFLTRALEHVRNHVAGIKDSQFTSVLNGSLTELHVYAAEKNAKLADSITPFNQLISLEHETDPGKFAVKNKWKEGTWVFEVDGKKLYATNCPFFHVEYDELYSMNATFLVCGDEQTAKIFLTDYHQSKWRRNRKGNCVLGYGGERMEDFRKMKWEDIFLANDMVQEIRGEIDTFFESEKAYKEHGLDWKRGMMFAGRPGNGKTAICRAIATDSKVPVIYCAMDDDDMFRILDRVERTIRSNCPCIVIFEDADTLASNEALRSAMLNMLDGLFTASGVLTIASTNAPEKLDEAFTGRPSRFDSFYIFGDPEATQCQKILTARLGDKIKRLPLAQVTALSKDMSGLSAACVQEVAVCALLASLHTKKPLSIEMLRAGLDKIKKHLRNSENGLEKVRRGSIGFANTNEEMFKGPEF